jgi:hypothetical protein
MRLRQRLKLLENALNVIDTDQRMLYKEYFKAWRKNHPQSSILMGQFEEYCNGKGCPSYRSAERVELTRADPQAAELARNIINSYRGFVKTTFGVTLNETG